MVRLENAKGPIVQKQKLKEWRVQCAQEEQEAMLRSQAGDIRCCLLLKTFDPE